MNYPSKPNIVAHAYNSRTWEVEEGPVGHLKFSISYIHLSFKVVLYPFYFLS